MVMNIEPELGVPLTDGVKDITLPERVEALDNTVNKLEEHGVDATPTKPQSALHTNVLPHLLPRPSS